MAEGRCSKLATGSAGACVHLLEINWKPLPKETLCVAQRETGRAVGAQEFRLDRDMRTSDSAHSQRPRSINAATRSRSRWGCSARFGGRQKQNADLVAGIAPRKTIRLMLDPEAFLPNQE